MWACLFVGCVCVSREWSVWPVYLCDVCEWGVECVGMFICVMCE